MVLLNDNTDVYICCAGRRRRFSSNLTHLPPRRTFLLQCCSPPPITTSSSSGKSPNTACYSSTGVTHKHLVRDKSDKNWRLIKSYLSIAISLSLSLDQVQIWQGGTCKQQPWGHPLTFVYFCQVSKTEGINPVLTSMKCRIRPCWFAINVLIRHAITEAGVVSQSRDQSHWICGTVICDLPWTSWTSWTGRARVIARRLCTYLIFFLANQINVMLAMKKWQTSEHWFR